MHNALKTAWAMSIVTLAMVAGLLYTAAAHRFGGGSADQILIFTGLTGFFAVITTLYLSRARRSR